MRQEIQTHLENCQLSLGDRIQVHECKVREQYEFANNFDYVMREAFLTTNSFADFLFSQPLKNECGEVIGWVESLPSGGLAITTDNPSSPTRIHLRIWADKRLIFSKHFLSTQPNVSGRLIKYYASRFPSTPITIKINHPHLLKYEAPGEYFEPL